MPGVRQIVHWLLLATFLLASIAVGARACQPGFLFGDVRWAEALWLGLATMTSLAALVRQLPVQNVLATTFIIFVILGGLKPLVLIVGFSATDATQGQSPIGALFWPGPWIWLIVLLNARGVARFVLRPWRSGTNYGFAVLGLATVVAILVQGTLGPMLDQNQYDKPAIRVDTAAVAGILISAVAAVLTLALITPFLINKRPVEERPQVAPVVVWVALTIVCLTWVVGHQRWFGAAVIAGQGILLALLVLLGRGRCRVEQPLAATP